jgi:hypothetical protein
MKIYLRVRMTDQKSMFQRIKQEKLRRYISEFYIIDTI